MNSNAEHQPKADPCGPGQMNFDPAKWLNWAERCGYRIYLSGTPKGGGFRIVTEAPCRPKSADDMALWREFQGQPPNSRANRAALIAHLIKTGRFDRSSPAGGIPSQPEAAGPRQSRPRPSGKDAQDGR